jgi:large subunit ribosomal protein L6
MSRIGKLPIPLPKGVDIIVGADNMVQVKGALGTLEQAMDSAIKLSIEDGKVVLTRESEAQDHRAKHGLYRALLANMIKGVSEGFTTVQEFVGVGYRVSVQENVLDMMLGYSHHIYFQLPKEIKAEAITERGKNPTLTMKSHDKQLLGQVAAKIRSLRKPEPYKGKGIRFKGEVLRTKAGKSASAK